jgi:hypothetical protein
VVRECCRKRWLVLLVIFRLCAMKWGTLWPLSAYPSLLNYLYCLVYLSDHFGFRIYWRTLECPVAPPYMCISIDCNGRCNSNVAEGRFSARGTSSAQAMPFYAFTRNTLITFRRVRVIVRTSFSVVISITLHETFCLPVVGRLWNLTRITGTLHEDLRYIC